MIAAMMITMPFDAESIPHKLGFMGLGTIFTCVLGLLYSLLLAKGFPSKASGSITTVIRKNPQANFVEAIIHGLFMFAALSIGYLVKMDNPYWIPISCAAVMLGASRYHILQRSFHRILGTFIGIGLSWVLLKIIVSPIHMILSIILLQFIIEMLVTRQYALAVIFMTPLTVFLAEAGNPTLIHSTSLITIRFWDIVLGSLIGAIGGWVLHHERLRVDRLRKTKLLRTFRRKRT